MEKIKLLYIVLVVIGIATIFYGFSFPLNSMSEMCMPSIWEECLPYLNYGYALIGLPFVLVGTLLFVTSLLELYKISKDKTPKHKTARIKC